MKRILLTAIVLLAAANLPLSARLPADQCKARCKGQSKAPRPSARALSKGPDRRARALPKGLPTSREAPRQATVGVARGAGTVAAKTGRGTWCIVTLGYGC